MMIQYFTVVHVHMRENKSLTMISFRESKFEDKHCTQNYYITLHLYKGRFYFFNFPQTYKYFFSPQNVIVMFELKLMKYENYVLTVSEAHSTQ